MDEYFFSILASMKSSNHIARDALTMIGYDYEEAVNANSALAKLVNKIADVLIDQNLQNQLQSETLIRVDSVRAIARKRQFEAYKQTADTSIPEIRDYLKEFGEEFKTKEVPTLLQEVNINY